MSLEEGRAAKHPTRLTLTPPQPPGHRHRFRAMVKPIGATCNHACSYCYYLHKPELLMQQGCLSLPLPFEGAGRRCP